jgi:hypothetical protein
MVKIREGAPLCPSRNALEDDPEARGEPAHADPTQPVEAGYMANAWLRMKHPDYDTLREMLDVVGRTLKARAR